MNALLKRFLDIFRLGQQQPRAAAVPSAPASTEPEPPDATATRSWKMPDAPGRLVLKRPATPGAAADKTYWWRIALRPRPVFPEFEAVNSKKEFERLKRKIDSGNFAMMEVPDNVMGVLKLLRRPDIPFDAIAAVIQKSPVMAGEFLKVANSSLYSRGNKVHHLGQALKLLGLEHIKSMLYLYSASHNISGSALLNDAASQVVEHSKAVSLIARYLSKKLFPDPDLAFLAGLLHDVGKLAILKQIGEDFNIPEFDFKLTEEAFTELFPPLHAKAGKLVSRSWDIEEEVALAIECHHDYPERNFDEGGELEILHLCALVDLSDMMAKMLGKGLFVAEGDIFEYPAAKYFNFEPDAETIKFLEPIPELVKNG